MLYVLERRGLSLKVTVSTVGRFHAFDLARQLLKRDSLARLYTGYPQWKVDSDLRQHSASFPWIVTPQMGFSRYGFKTLADSLNELACNSFDKWVSHRPLDCDVLVTQSQSGLHSLIAAKSRGIKTVCLRGSTHIVYQKSLLTDELHRHGINTIPVPSWALEKELSEYETADLIEVNSKFVYESFLENGVAKEKLFLVHQGVDLSLFRPIAKMDDTFRVLFAGTMSLRKGIQYLLEALAQLDLPNFEIMLVGSMLDEVKPIFTRYRSRFRYFRTFASRS